jgi:hypothetical protein
LVGRAVPPLEAAYHCIAVPVATKFAIVGLLIAQNVWGVVAVGAAGLLTVAVTLSLAVPSQPETV